MRNKDKAVAETTALLQITGCDQRLAILKTLHEKNTIKLTLI